MDNLMLGGIAAGSLVAGLFFFRFWRQTRDRFFLLFAISFWLEAANRTAFGLLPYPDEDEPFFYLVRLVSYALILLAIWQKNRRPGR